MVLGKPGWLRSEKIWEGQGVDSELDSVRVWGPNQRLLDNTLICPLAKLTFSSSGRDSIVQSNITVTTRRSVPIAHLEGA